MGNEEDVVMVTDKNAVVLTAPKLAVDLTKYTQKVQCPADNNGMIKLFASFVSMGTIKNLAREGLGQSKHSFIHGYYLNYLT